jgi:hypothetical protein
MTNEYPAGTLLEIIDDDPVETSHQLPVGTIVKVVDKGEEEWFAFHWPGHQLVRTLRGTHRWVKPEQCRVVRPVEDLDDLYV